MTVPIKVGVPLFFVAICCLCGGVLSLLAWESRREVKPPEASSSRNSSTLVRTVKDLDCELEEIEQAILDEQKGLLLDHFDGMNSDADSFTGFCTIMVPSPPPSQLSQLDGETREVIVTWMNSYARSSSEVKECTRQLESILRERAEKLRQQLLSQEPFIVRTSEGSANRDAKVKRTDPTLPKLGQQLVEFDVEVYRQLIAIRSKEAGELYARLQQLLQILNYSDLLQSLRSDQDSEETHEQVIRRLTQSPGVSTRFAQTLFEDYRSLNKMTRDWRTQMAAIGGDGSPSRLSSGSN